MAIHFRSLISVPRKSIPHSLRLRVKIKNVGLLRATRLERADLGGARLLTRSGGACALSASPTALHIRGVAADNFVSIGRLRRSRVHREKAHFPSPKTKPLQNHPLSQVLIPNRRSRALADFFKFRALQTGGTLRDPQLSKAPSVTFNARQWLENLSIPAHLVDRVASRVRAPTKSAKNPRKDRTCEFLDFFKIVIF